MSFDYAKYHRERYKNDPEYRKNRIRWSAVWDKNNREKINTIHRKWYANRTLQQIKRRRQPLKKMRTIGKWKNNCVSNRLMYR